MNNDRKNEYINFLNIFKQEMNIANQSLQKLLNDLNNVKGQLDKNNN